MRKNIKNFTKLGMEKIVNLISGNFYQTDNNYKILVYYRPPGEIYDQLIGFGELNSKNILN